MTPPDRAALERVMADAAWAAAHPTVPLDASRLETVTYGFRVQDAKAHLAALEAAGCVVMPVEPTDDMLRAGHSHVTAKGAYRAMVANSPYRSRT